MKKEWYIFINSGHIGPYSLVEMKAFYDKKDIKENTLIWKEGMKEWLPVKKVDLFSPLLDDVPPPLPPEVFNIPKKIETTSIPSILQPIKEEIFETDIFPSKNEIKKSKVEFKFPTKIIWIIFPIIILIAGALVYQNSALPNLRIKGVSPYNRQQLENQLAIDESNLSFALALSMDKSNLWITSNQGQNLSVTVDLSADTKRVLGDEIQEDITVRLQGMIVNHLGHFTTMRMLKGSKFYPGEYNVHIKGKKIHWLNKYLKLNQHSLNEPFSIDFKTLIYSGNAKEFDRKLAERRMYKITRSIKPVQNKIEALQTLKALLNKNMTLFLTVLNKTKKGSDFVDFEKQYMKDISPLVQNIVMIADADLKKEVEHKTVNQAQIDLGRRIGEEAVEMIGKVTSIKKLDAKTKKNLIDHFEKKRTWIDSMISVYIGQMESLLKSLQSQIHP